MKAKTLPRRFQAVLIVVLIAVLFFAVNLAANSGLRTAHLDLTENRLYSLSDGTKHTLAKLDKPITLKFFFSRETAAGYAQVIAYANRVRDLLQEYAAHSGGKITVQEIDPQAFTPEEDQAVAEGLTAVSTADGKNVYFGLAGSNTAGGKEVIPFFAQDRETYLEYDLTSVITRLSETHKPVLGIISGLPLASGSGGLEAQLLGNAQPFTIYDELKKTFTVQTVAADAGKIPDSIAALMLVHPTGLTKQTLYAIDQYVMHGGHVIAFVDPLSEVLASSGQASSTSSDLAPLLQAWGVEFDPTKVVADASRAQRVQFNQSSSGNSVGDYVVWLKLTQEDFDSHDPLTAQLQKINLATAGALAKAQGATTTFTPLIKSSPDSELIDATRAQNVSDPADLLRDFKAGGKAFTLAARITGPAKSAFPDGPPEATATVTDGTAKDHRAQADNIQVLVVADADLFDDRFWVQTQSLSGQRFSVPNADNGAFILNAAENLMGSNDLLSLRTRASSDRSFVLVDELRKQAEQRYLAEEQTLQQKLTQTQQRISQLEQSGKNGSSDTALSSASQAEIDKFRNDLIQTRSALRAVQADLQKDVTALGTRLAFFNIVFVPFLVAVAAIGLALLRRRRRAQARLRG
jgi:ABC-type uncharacterized transport system involved in gliding motility auxiliary subunit